MILPKIITIPIDERVAPKPLLIASIALVGEFPRSIAIGSVTSNIARTGFILNFKINSIRNATAPIKISKKVLGNIILFPPNLL
ncbi:hypothetical protein SDC9_174235 [bioreactor metagenome]|uniref:Uncharacterized protein n=1 Tax=bioreactor metagenome TaxID=1076179 RepID=A0A645GKY7_9ZZZZ